MAEPSNTLPWEEAQSHASIYMQRERAVTKEEQNRLAGTEHRAFAREAVAENPLMAIPIAAAIPVYQAAKVVGATDSRSDASLSQATEGLKGVKEGLVQSFKAPWEEAQEAAKNFANTLPAPVKKAIKSVLPWQEASQAAEKATGVPTPPPIVLKAPEPSKGIPTEKDMVKAAMFTPAEIAARDVQMTSDAFLSEMKEAIDSTKDPARKAVLQKDYDTLVKRKKK